MDGRGVRGYYKVKQRIGEGLAGLVEKRQYRRIAFYADLAEWLAVVSAKLKKAGASVFIGLRMLLSF
jgi:hypothetical protein